MARSSQNSPVKLLTNVWHWLTEPEASGKEPGRRRQARLLASLLVAFILLTIMLFVVPSLFNATLPPQKNPDFYVAVGVAATFAVAYVLNRTGRYAVAAFLTVTALSAGILAAAAAVFSGTNPYYEPDDVNLLVFLVVPVLFAGMLLSIPATTVVVTLSIVGMIFLAMLFPQVTLAMIAGGPLTLVLAVSSLILLAAHHRNRLELDRQARLAESEERYRLRFEHVTDVVYSLSPKLKILSVSPSVERMLGYKPEDLIGRPFQELNTLTSDFLETALSDARRVLAGERVTSSVYEFVAKDGTRKFGEVSGAPLVRDGEVAAVVAVARDITERKRAEEELQQRTAQVRLLFEAGQRLGQSLNLDTILGTIHDVVSQTMTCDGLVVSSYSQEDNLIRCVAMYDEGTPLDVSEFPPIPLEPEGKGTQSIAIRTGKSLILADFQEQRQTAQTSYDVGEKGIVSYNEVSEDEEITRSALIVPLKSEGRVIGVVQVFSYRLDDFIEDDLDFLEALAPQIAAAMTNALLYRQAQREIDERKRVEEARRWSEERYRSFIEHSSEAIWRLELEEPTSIELPDDEQIQLFYQHGYVAEANEAMARMHGFPSAKDVVGTRLGQLLPRLSPHNVEYLRAFIRSGYRVTDVESREMDQQGNVRYFMASLIGIVENGSLARLWGVKRDITERKRAEEELRKHREHLEDLIAERTAELTKANEQLRHSEERLTLAIVGTGGALWDEKLDPDASFDDQSGTTYYSLEERKLLGYGEGNELVPHYEAWYDHVLPEDQALVEQRQRDHFEGRTEHLDHEYRVRHKDGSIRWVHGRSYIVRDERGRPVRWIGIDWDVTERKQAEEELKDRTAELNERVAEVEQLNRGMVNLLEDLQAAKDNLEETAAKLQEMNQELNDFAYVVSHDLKAPLRAVTQLAGWIATDYADDLDEEGQEMLSLLVGRAKRMHNLIQGILEYSRIGRIKEREKEVDLNWLVQDTIEMLGPPEHIQITIKSELPTVMGEQVRLEQVFQNLLGNAIKFMDKSAGCVIIDCADEGAHWLLSVADNGPGIEEKYHDKIFQMFQTLAPRDEFESTGVGLSLVKKIVETGGGKVWVESAIGEGSTFYFTLPKRGS